MAEAALEPLRSIRLQFMRRPPSPFRLRRGFALAALGVGVPATSAPWPPSAPIAARASGLAGLPVRLRLARYAKYETCERSLW